MNNKTKKGMMSRFLDSDDVSTAPSPTAPVVQRPVKSLSGLDVLNKAVGALGPDSGQQKVQISSLGIDPKNKRALSPAEFKRLKDSIQADGLFNPITVRKSNDPKFLYIVVAGHNRLQAIKELGQKTVPVNVVDLKDDGAKAAFISNLLQPELGIAEVFEGLRILRAGEGEQKSVRQLAAETGFSPAYISQVMSLEQIPSEIVLAMKLSRVRVGANTLKDFVRLFESAQGEALKQLTADALTLLEGTFKSIKAFSANLSSGDVQAHADGEDTFFKTWQLAFKWFIDGSTPKKPKSPGPSKKHKVDIRGWGISNVKLYDNNVVLSFETEDEAALFLEQYQKSKKN